MTEREVTAKVRVQGISLSEQQYTQLMADTSSVGTMLSPGSVSLSTVRLVARSRHGATPIAIERTLLHLRGHCMREPRDRARPELTTFV